MKYKLYAFDFDLTLADTLEVSVISYKRAYSSIGLGFDEENIFSELGKSIESSFEDLKRENRLIGDFSAYESAFYDAVDEHFCKVTLYRDVEKTFSRLKSNGAKIAVITNRKRSAIDSALKKYPSISPLIDFFSTSDLTDKLKPLPDPIFLALAALGASDRETVYIGDAENDEICARAAGVDFIYMDRFGRIKKRNKITSLSELP